MSGHTAAAVVEPPKFGPGVIETASGHAYDYEAPNPDNILLTDIAQALSNMCRFAGHTKRFYSVAEHCVLVSRILEAEGAPEGWQRVGLLHDAHEAYVWDAPRPIKPLLGEDFERLVEKADLAICQALNVATPVLFHTATVKHADDVALVAESLQLMTHGAERWESRPDVEALDPTILEGAPWTIPGIRITARQGKLGLIPAAAKAAFLTRCRELGVS